MEFSERKLHHRPLFGNNLQKIYGKIFLRMAADRYLIQIVDENGSIFTCCTGDTFVRGPLI